MASNIPNEDFSCPVCFETYRRPKVLNCGHTFCEECIHEYIMKNKATTVVLKRGIECPLCRNVTKFRMGPSQSEKWAASLCSNFALESILAKPVKTLPNAGQNLETKYICQPCLDESSRKGATVFCTNCCQFQCADCAKCHKKFGVTKGHDVITIEGYEKKMEFITSISQLQLCDKHKQEIIHFCTTHSKLCCNKCKREDHTDCITTRSRKYKTSRLEIMQKSMTDLNRNLKLAAKFWLSRNDIQPEVTSILRNINARRERVNNEFDMLKQQAIQLLETENRKRKPMCEENHVICLQLSNEVDKALLDLETAFQYGTQKQKFIFACRLQDRLDAIVKSSEEEFFKLKDIQVTVKYISLIDEISFGNEELGHPELNSVGLSVNDINDFICSSLKLNAKANQDASSFYRSIDFLSDGRLVAVDHPKRKLLLFDRELKCIYEKELKYTPLYVKTLPKGDSIVVTTGESRRLLYFDLKEDDTLFCTGTTIIKGMCESVAPVNDTSFFVRLFGDKTPLGIVGNYSNEKDVFIDLPEKEYTVDSTKIAFDTVSQKLAISDKRTDTVYIVDNRRKTSVTLYSKEIIHPRGVVFGGDDSLYICSDGTDSIVRVSTSGEVLSIRKLTMSNPYAICISKDKRQLAVTNIGESNKQIQVLDIV